MNFYFGHYLEDKRADWNGERGPTRLEAQILLLKKLQSFLNLI